MDMKEIIRTRKSVRTFDGKPLSAEDKTKILNYVGTIANPYNIPVKFVWLDKDKHGLSSPVIVGEAANMQPCRIVKDGNKYHFYEQHKDGYRNAYAWDVQKIDMGIALCHFMSVTDGSLIMENPNMVVNEDTEYIATIAV